MDEKKELNFDRSQLDQVLQEATDSLVDSIKESLGIKDVKCFDDEASDRIKITPVYETPTPQKFPDYLTHDHFLDAARYGTVDHCATLTVGPELGPASKLAPEPPWPFIPTERIIDKQDYIDFETFKNIKKTLGVNITYIFKAISFGLTIVSNSPFSLGESTYYGNVSLVGLEPRSYAFSCQDITTGKSAIIPLKDIPTVYKGCIHLGVFKEPTTGGE